MANVFTLNFTATHQSGGSYDRLENMATKQTRATKENKYPLWLSSVEITRLEAKERKKGKSEDVLTGAKSDAVKAKESSKASKIKYTCPICEDVIQEAQAGITTGHDSVYCDGLCRTWLHRGCAGLSKKAFEALSKSKDKFLCLKCTFSTQKATSHSNDSTSHFSDLHSLLADIETQLKASLADLIAQALAPLRSLLNDRVQALNSKLNALDSEFRQQLGQLSADLNCLRMATSQKQIPDVPPAAANSPLVNLTSAPIPRHNTNLNLVVYGVQESKKGTPRHIRVEEDLKSVTSTLSSIDNAIDDHFIRDCIRLGKYKEDAHSPRPILAKFVRSTDVSRLLSKRSKLRHPTIIKPDMTPSQRYQEAVLLKQRWLLIQDGTPKQSIKIRKDKLFINGRPHGQVIDSEYKLLPLISDFLPTTNSQSKVPTPPTSNSTSAQPQTSSSGDSLPCD